MKYARFIQAIFLLNIKIYPNNLFLILKYYFNIIYKILDISILYIFLILSRETKKVIHEPFERYYNC